MRSSLYFLFGALALLLLVPAPPIGKKEEALEHQRILQGLDKALAKKLEELISK